MNQSVRGFLVALLVTAAASCAKQESVSSDTTANMSTVASTTSASAVKTKKFKVTLKISGAAHLVDGATPPFLIVPNFLKEDPPHQAFLLAIPAGVAPGGLTNTRDQLDMDHLDPHTNQPLNLGTFMFSEIPAGVEIDLEQSGVVFPAGSTLTFVPGDASNDVCPSDVPGVGTPPNSMHWIPRLSKVSKQSKPFDLKSTFTSKDPSGDLVAARLEMKGGSLEPELSPLRRAYRFRIGGVDADDDVVQTVSMSLNYTFLVDLPEDKPVFTLQGRKFGTTTLIPLGSFKPFTGTDQIQIDLINLPEDEFFKLHDTRSLPHFHMHYAVFSGFPLKAVPKLVQNCSGGSIKPLFECGPTN